MLPRGGISGAAARLLKGSSVLKAAMAAGGPRLHQGTYVHAIGWSGSSGACRRSPNFHIQPTKHSVYEARRGFQAVASLKGKHLMSIDSLSYVCVPFFTPGTAPPNHSPPLMIHRDDELKGLLALSTDLKRAYTKKNSVSGWCFFRHED